MPVPILTQLRIVYDIQWVTKMGGSEGMDNDEWGGSGGSEGTGDDKLGGRGKPSQVILVDSKKIEDAGIA